MYLLRVCRWVICFPQSNKKVVYSLMRREFTNNRKQTLTAYVDTACTCRSILTLNDHIRLRQSHTVTGEHFFFFFLNDCLSSTGIAIVCTLMSIEKRGEMPTTGTFISGKTTYLKKSIQADLEFPWN